MKSHDPFTGAKLTSRAPDTKDPRMGTPADKFGMSGTPVLTADRRQAVMLMLFPPEALRDQSLPMIEQVIASQGPGLLKAIALEIYKSYTSDPLDASAARTTGEALLTHADALARGGHQ